MKRLVLAATSVLLILPDLALAVQSAPERRPGPPQTRPAPPGRPHVQPPRPGAGGPQIQPPRPGRPGNGGPQIQPPRPGNGGRRFNRHVQAGLVRAMAVRRFSRRVPVAPVRSGRRVRRIAPAPDVRPISGRSTDPDSSIRAAIAIAAG